MSSAAHEQNNIIFYEMMSHPALFTHPHPKKVIIIGDENGNILQEVKKHDPLTEIIVINKNILTSADSRIKYYSDDSIDWINKITPSSIDIIMHAAQPNNSLLKKYFSLLQDDGFFIQQSASPFEMATVKSLADELRAAGFNDQHILNFPQPSFYLGWRSILLATKKTGFKRIREKAIFSKSFKTYYYNLDTHKAALVLPEFMREEWII